MISPSLLQTWTFLLQLEIPQFGKLQSYNWGTWIIARFTFFILFREFGNLFDFQLNKHILLLASSAKFEV